MEIGGAVIASLCGQMQNRRRVTVRPTLNPL